MKKEHRDASEKLPACIRFMEDRIGKPASSFTKFDWKATAILAGNTADRFFEELHPEPRKRGRPKVSSDIFRKIFATLPKDKGGRPPQKYYGLTAPEFRLHVDNWMKEPGGPKTQAEAIRRIAMIFKKYFRGYHDPQAIARAIRRDRQEADKSQRQIKNK